MRISGLALIPIILHHTLCDTHSSLTAYSRMGKSKKAKTVSNTGKFSLSAHILVSIQHNIHLYNRVKVNFTQR